MGLSALNKQRFSYNLTVNKYCNHCINIVEDTQHFFLFCTKYETCRDTLLRKICELISPNVNPYTVLNVMPDQLISVMLCGSDSLDYQMNIRIFDHVFEFIKETNRFQV